MAQVTVTIDGKAYRMACEEGQEDHLVDLATRFDQYVTHLKGQFGEIGDLRITVMAGIMIMDELSELKRKIAALESEANTLRASRETIHAATARTEENLAAALTEVTMRIQAVAEKLSGKVEAEPG